MSETNSYIFCDIGGALCLDFVNTISSHFEEHPIEHLNTYADLVEWGRQRGVLSDDDVVTLTKHAEQHPEEADRALGQAVDIRRTLYGVFSSVSREKPVSKGNLYAFNSYLSDAMGHTEIVEHGEHFDWGWKEAEGDLERMLWPVMRSAADLLTSAQIEMVRECGGDDCGWLFVDTSKNHSRRWCSMSDCGNRAKVKRFYRKQKAAS